jgi:hypothetical protein
VASSSPNIDDVRPQFSNSNGTYLSQNAIFQSTLVRGLPGLPPASSTINAQNGAPMTAVSGMKQLAKPWYSDQILPFDITLAGASEYGAATAMKIYGVEILDEGSGVSIAAQVTKMQATFVARTRCSEKNDFLPLAGEGAGRSRVSRHDRGGAVAGAGCRLLGVLRGRGAVLGLARSWGRLLYAMTVAMSGKRVACPWLSVLPWIWL